MSEMNHEREMFKIILEDEPYEVTKAQFLDYVQRVFKAITDFALASIHTHAAHLADFNGTHVGQEILVIRKQVDLIEQQISDPGFQEAFRALTDLARKVSEIDEQIVQAYCRALHLAMPTAEQRRRLGARIKQYRYGAPGYQFSYPDEVMILSQESQALESAVEAAYQQVDEEIVRLRCRA